MDHIHLTREQKAELQEDSLGEKLRVVIDKLPLEGVTLVEILDLVGKDSLLLLAVFLTLVFLIPVSIPGVSTLFGAAILLIGVSRLFGRNLWLPKSFRNRIVSTDKLRAALKRALVWFHRLERMSRPHRLNMLTSDGLMGILNNCSLILGAILLMAPFGLVPFSNTLPALSILFLAIGLLQRDGVCILLGYLANFATIIYFTILIAGGGMATREAIRHLFG
ncbi:MAG: exopolysaccharide biosynthesis protein [Sedimentisphaerales bacterium]|nr:exopolysaccharide biosynthesis protein [Sedimentisphaerales bacterium]